MIPINYTIASRTTTMIIMAIKSIIVYQRHHDQHECHDVTRHLNIKMFKTGTDAAAELTEQRVICYIGEAQAGGS